MLYVICDCIRFVFVDLFGAFWGSVLALVFTYSVLGVSAWGLLKLLRLILVKRCHDD